MMAWDVDCVHPITDATSWSIIMHWITSSFSIGPIPKLQRLPSGRIPYQSLEVRRGDCMAPNGTHEISTNDAYQVAPVSTSLLGAPSEGVVL